MTNIVDMQKYFVIEIWSLPKSTSASELNEV